MFLMSNVSAAALLLRNRRGRNLGCALARGDGVHHLHGDGRELGFENRLRTKLIKQLMPGAPNTSRKNKRKEACAVQE